MAKIRHHHGAIDIYHTDDLGPIHGAGQHYLRCTLTRSTELRRRNFVTVGSCPFQQPFAPTGIGDSIQDEHDFLGDVKPAEVIRTQPTGTVNLNRLNPILLRSRRQVVLSEDFHPALGAGA
ncbi:MAG: hypothetical protein BWY63_03784 [Chloroflexi bacterium ADurb.Bin360]|nr:MAG: hypothetical protein BWY63_03784 [Chloroflexi bacterium ADurb.Bin360]